MFWLNIHKPECKQGTHLGAIFKNQNKELSHLDIPSYKNFKKPQ